MSTLSRRAAAQFGLAAIVGGMAAACVGKTTDQLTSDVQLVASGLSGIVNTLRNPALNVPTDVLDKAQAAIDIIEANAGSVGTSLTPNASAINAIANAVSTLASLLTPFFPIAPIVGAVVQAALALLPTLLAFAGKPPPAAAKRAATVMQPGQAREVLRGAPTMLAR